MSHVKQPRIYLTNEWGAKPAKSSPIYVGRPDKSLFHHTAGHHAEISLPADESLEELFRYARDIQHFHMAPGGLGVPQGGNDSGHNFLIGRNGAICVGRHMSYPAIKKGKMVLSAHCPGQNNQPGVEHEHNGTERMTKAQFAASAHLYAWIIACCKMSGASSIHPHKEFFATSCPGVLESELPALKVAVNQIIREATPGI